MTLPINRLSFLTRKESIKFLQAIFRELRKLTIRDGLKGARSSIDRTMQELKKAENQIPPNSDTDMT